MRQWKIRKFVLLILEPARLEFLEKIQLFGRAKSCEIWFLHDENVDHILQHSDASLEKVKFVVDQNRVDQFPGRLSNFELFPVPGRLLKVALPNRVRNTAIQTEISGPAAALVYRFGKVGSGNKTAPRLVWKGPEKRLIKKDKKLLSKVENGFLGQSATHRGGKLFLKSLVSQMAALLMRYVWIHLYFITPLATLAVSAFSN